MADMETEEHHNDPPNPLASKRRSQDLSSSSQEDVNGGKEFFVSRKKRAKSVARRQNDLEMRKKRGEADGGGRECTIVVTVEDGKAKKFFSDTVGVFRKIERSIIGQVGIKTAIRNEKRQTMTIVLKSDHRLKEILDLKRLDEYEIKCSLPRAEQQLEHRYGVIGPIGLDTKTEEIEQILKDEGYEVQVERLKKREGNEWKDTQQIKICFPVRELPKYIHIMYERFEVRQYVSRPWQCFNCQGFGHSARWCQRKQKCMICAKEHKYNECPNRENGTKMCANCGQNHAANYSGCVKMRKEREVQQMRCKEHITYSNAVRKIRERDQMNGNQMEGSCMQGGTPNIKASGWKAALQAQPGTSGRYTERTHMTARKETRTSEVATQTVKVTDSSTSTGQISNDGEMQDERQAAFLLEVISAVTQANSVQKRCKLIVEAYETYFNSSLSVQSIQEYMTGKARKDKGTNRSSSAGSRSQRSK